MRYCETRGTVVGLPITIQGIVDEYGEVEAVRVIGIDGVSDSWAYSDKQIADFAQILKNSAEMLALS